VSVGRAIDMCGEPLPLLGLLLGCKAGVHAHLCQPCTAGAHAQPCQPCTQCPPWMCFPALVLAPWGVHICGGRSGRCVGHAHTLSPQAGEGFFRGVAQGYPVDCGWPCGLSGLTVAAGTAAAGQGKPGACVQRPAWQGRAADPPYNL